VIGQTGIFAMFMALLVLVAITVYALAEETRGRSLEEISQTTAAA
jgi:hypothetical protein